MENGEADIENKMIVPPNKTEEWGDSAIAFVGPHLRDMRSQRRYCIPMLIDALFAIVKREKINIAHSYSRTPLVSKRKF